MPPEKRMIVSDDKMHVPRAPLFQVSSLAVQANQPITPFYAVFGSGNQNSRC